MAGMSALGGIASANATRQAGLNAQAQANDQAAQLDQQAKQERAISHYEMAKRQRDAKARASETLAGLSSRGFAADDPSSIALISDNAGAETLEQLLTKAMAEQRARGMESEGRSLRTYGRNASKAATLTARADLVGSASSWYDRYGRGIAGSAPRNNKVTAG